MFFRNFLNYSKNNLKKKRYKIDLFFLETKYIFIKIKFDSL